MPNTNHSIFPSLTTLLLPVLIFLIPCSPNKEQNEEGEGLLSSFYPALQQLDAMFAYSFQFGSLGFHEKEDLARL